MSITRRNLVAGGALAAGMVAPNIARAQKNVLSSQFVRARRSNASCFNTSRRLGYVSQTSNAKKVVSTCSPAGPCTAKRNSLDRVALLNRPTAKHT